MFSGNFPSCFGDSHFCLGGEKTRIFCGPGGLESSTPAPQSANAQHQTFSHWFNSQTSLYHCSHISFKKQQQSFVTLNKKTPALLRPGTPFQGSPPLSGYGFSFKNNLLIYTRKNMGAVLTLHSNSFDVFTDALNVNSKYINISVSILFLSWIIR